MNPVVTMPGIGTSDIDIAGLVARLKPRTRSLIVTVYGDAILPLGGSAWLGSLIRLVAPLGLGDRLVRTAVWRLAQDGILEATQSGRRSYYALTETGRRQFEAAQRRIYAMPDDRWDGAWLIAIAPPSVAPQARDALRRELSWLGFAPVAPGVLVLPHGDQAAAARAVAGLGLSGQVVLLRASAAEASGLRAQYALADEGWPLEQIAVRYRAFLDVFGPVAEAVARARPDPERCLAVRLLMIHAYRRALLLDPMLPPALLPDGWPGRAAAMLCRDLYRLIGEPAQAHAEAVVETADGPEPPVGAPFTERFDMTHSGRSA